MMQFFKVRNKRTNLEIKNVIANETMKDKENLQ